MASKHWILLKKNILRLSELFSFKLSELLIDNKRMQIIINVLYRSPLTRLKNYQKLSKKIHIALILLS